MIDRIAPPAAEAGRAHQARASVAAVKAVLLVAGAVFALAAVAHGLRYLLLLINRTRLLPPLVANGTVLMGILVSLAAIVAVAAVAAVMTSWLIDRRAEAYRLRGQDDPRPEWALWAGCLIPVVNLVWAPVFVIELAHVEQCRERLRVPITLWWIGWTFSTLVSAWAIWTSSATQPQAIADNTVTMIIAYLAGLAVLLLVWRVFEGFVGRPVQQSSAHRWVVLPEAPAQPAESGEAVESEDREPAA